MPTRCSPNKTEPIAFSCPSCGAKYIIVTIDVPRDGQHNKFDCVMCDALFPLGEGRRHSNTYLYGLNLDALISTAASSRQASDKN